MVRCFRHARHGARKGLVAELGLLFVVHNIIGSLFNSHLFEFLEGWLYVLGGKCRRRHLGEAYESARQSAAQLRGTTHQMISLSTLARLVAKAGVLAENGVP